jgi:hypothetical protein
MSVVLLIQHAKRMRRFVVCNLFGFTTLFPLFLINGTTFGEKTSDYKLSILIFSTIFV